MAHTMVPGEPVDRWCWTCDKIVPCGLEQDYDAWRCEQGHRTTGLQAHLARKLPGQRAKR